MPTARASLAAALVALGLAAACGGRGGGGGGGAAAPGGRASGEADAWQRAHRLLDLFDLARFARDDAALAELSRELAGAPDGLRRGPAGTESALELLAIEVDAILARDRLHKGAVAARTLLDFDGRPPADRAEVWRRTMELKSIARGGGPLAGGARLRLAGFCVRALRDAAAAPLRHRVRIASHCLYPAHDSDPEPYFAADPRQRPPAPEWPRVVAGVEELLAPGPAWGRLEPARAALAAAARAAAEAAELPVEPSVTGAPLVAGAAPYDWTPLVTAGAPIDEEALAAALQADGRGRVALVLDRSVAADSAGSGAAIVEAARAAVRAGAGELELVVATEQVIEVPPGDHWSGRIEGGAVRRAGVVPISLAPLGAEPGDRTPRRLRWSIGMQLHLAIERGRWRLTAPAGSILLHVWQPMARGPRVLPPGPEPLVEWLGRLRRAYPEEQNLALVIAPEASYQSVVLLAGAAAAGGGAPRFRLGLAASAPRARGASLQARVIRRAGAEVAIVPDTLAARAPALLDCYRPLVEREPAPAGAIRLELRGGSARAVGKADRRLVRCALGALGDAMAKAGAESAEVTFKAGSR